MQMNYPRRLSDLAELLRAQRLDGLLVTHLPNVRYLCGFTGSSGVLALSVSGRGHKAAFFTDGRYTEQAREQVVGAQVVIPKPAAIGAALNWLGAKQSRGR